MVYTGVKLINYPCMRCNTMSVQCCMGANIPTILRLLLWLPTCKVQKVDKLDDIKNFRFKKGNRD